MRPRQSPDTLLPLREASDTASLDQEPAQEEQEAGQGKVQEKEELAARLQGGETVVLGAKVHSSLQT